MGCCRVFTIKIGRWGYTPCKTLNARWTNGAAGAGLLALRTPRSQAGPVTCHVCRGQKEDALIMKRKHPEKRSCLVNAPKEGIEDDRAA
eukprot:4445736-Pyramimonas_sp.AAC.1